MDTSGPKHMICRYLNPLGIGAPSSMPADAASAHAATRKTNESTQLRDGR